MQLLAVIAISAAAPFVTTLEPGTDGAAAAPTAPAAQTAAVDASVVSAAIKQPAVRTAKPAPTAPNSGALTNLVADAIKRKLDKAAAGKGSGIVELPGAAPTSGAPTEPSPGMYIPNVMPGGPIGGGPDPSMLSGDAKMMMGSPTDGSPAHVRVLTQEAAQAPAAAPKAQANPLANSTDPMEAGTNAAPAAAEPGANHNLLDIFVGTWDVSANFDNGPGQPPETASGQMSNTWQLDGRWLKQDYTGQMASLGAFRGLGYLGYDNLAKTYVATWMDTLSTTCLVSKGTFSEEKATFTFAGDFTAPGGEKYKQKQVMTVLSPDRYTVTMYLAGPDGVEFKTGNLEYTRSVRATTNVSAK